MPKITEPGGGKRHPLSMRTTRALRARLEAAAEASGRSLAHEVEHRLEKSFNPWTDMDAAAVAAVARDALKMSLERQTEYLKKMEALSEQIPQSGDDEVGWAQWAKNNEMRDIAYAFGTWAGQMVEILQAIQLRQDPTKKE